MQDLFPYITRYVMNKLSIISHDNLVFSVFIEEFLKGIQFLVELAFEVKYLSIFPVFFPK